MWFQVCIALDAVHTFAFLLDLHYAIFIYKLRVDSVVTVNPFRPRSNL